MSNSSAAEDERSLSVLVVEDEFFIAMELKGALDRAGYRVMGPVGSVTDALDLIARERPDTAVLDVNLRRERVTPLAAHLKAINVPFVIASASSPAELAQEDAFVGAPHLGKPTSLSDLVDVVRALLGQGG